MVLYGLKVSFKYKFGKIHFVLDIIVMMMTLTVIGMAGVGDGDADADRYGDIC